MGIDRIVLVQTASERIGKVNAEQAKKVKIGTVVIWDNNPEDVGVVTNVQFQGFHIQWANESGWVDYSDAQKISILEDK